MSDPGGAPHPPEQATSASPDRHEVAAREVGDPPASERLRAKPILEWTREDWRAWVEGSDGRRPAARAPSRADDTPGASAHQATIERQEPGPRTGTASGGEATEAARQPDTPAKPAARAGGSAAGNAGAKAGQLASPPNGRGVGAGARPPFGRPAPSAPPSRQPRPAASVPPRAGPPQGHRPLARAGRPRLLRSAMSLLGLSVVVGVIVAGLVAVAVVAAGLALRSAVG